ncbi:MAG TPA: tRNA pseudouridine(38-40) synthase TruA [Candidatus Polarisedimenticolia bacterium]|jgi:tRNA pseudouridine38-40 synthase|nr:tRNA pseudouridine(38-40) synthase TruA [Candidatus Polarisedimenticolia bacterium]
MVVAYVGTRYAGWQVQPGRPTIQGVLEERLSLMLGETIALAGAGRTDSGVHALGQVASFSTARSIPLDGLRRGLNARLPEEIRVMQASEAKPSFHARSDARGKEYRYRFAVSEVVSPFEAPFVWPLRGRPDAAAMRRAAVAFEGRHDFTSLAPADCELDDRVRTLGPIAVEEKEREIVLSVHGDGFLRHMVRTLAGTVLEAGLGKRDPESMGAVLEARDRRAAGVRAPARGLTLVRVLYDAEGPCASC